MTRATTRQAELDDHDRGEDEAAVTDDAAQPHAAPEAAEGPAQLDQLGSRVIRHLHCRVGDGLRRPWRRRLVADLTQQRPSGSLRAAVRGRRSAQSARRRHELRGQRASARSPSTTKASALLGQNVSRGKPKETCCADAGCRRTARSCAAAPRRTVRDRPRSESPAVAVDDRRRRCRSSATSAPGRRCARSEWPVRSSTLAPAMVCGRRAEVRPAGDAG